MDLFEGVLEFEWDRGNRDKNFLKHRVTNEECEEVFSDPHKRLVKYILHPQGEVRRLLVGRTVSDRFLFVVFVMRRHKVRVISARDLNKRERHLYEERP